MFDHPGHIELDWMPKTQRRDLKHGNTTTLNSLNQEKTSGNCHSSDRRAEVLGVNISKILPRSTDKVALWPAFHCNESNLRISFAMFRFFTSFPYT